MGQRIRLTEGDLHRIVKESVKKVLKEYGGMGRSQASTGANVKPYTSNMWVVSDNTGVRFYVDRNGNFYDSNKQPTHNVRGLTDFDAGEVAYELNKAIGNMFHWDMFRGGEPKRYFE